MAEIDLIPADYRNWLTRKAKLVSYTIVLVTINVVIAGAGLLLTQLAERQQRDVTRLQSENAITQQQQQQLQQIDDEYSEFERRWSLLRGLRAGAAVDDIFLLIDRSIKVGELWFLEWSFQRAGIIVHGEQRGVETGYFVLVGEGNATPSTTDLSVETHMTIRGQAKDHAALSTFVRTLFEQEDVKDVNLQKTSQTGYANGRVVDFNMTIVLNSEYRES